MIDINYYQYYYYYIKNTKNERHGVWSSDFEQNAFGSD